MDLAKFDRFGSWGCRWQRRQWRAREQQRWQGQGCGLCRCASVCVGLCRSVSVRVGSCLSVSFHVGSLRSVSASVYLNLSECVCTCLNGERMERSMPITHLHYLRCRSRSIVSVSRQVVGHHILSPYSQVNSGRVRTGRRCGDERGKLFNGRTFDRRGMTRINCHVDALTFLTRIRLAGSVNANTNA
jgi:hypothetical protein